jgi:galactosamine-6-phosphate isomerase
MLRHIHIEPNYECMSSRAAEFVIDAIAQKPDLVICCSTGDTPKHTWDIVAKRYGAERFQTDNITIVKFDEIFGLPFMHPSTSEAYLRERVIDPLKIPLTHFVNFDPTGPDPSEECSRVEAKLHDLGGIDLTVTGFGINGNLGKIQASAESGVSDAHVEKLYDSTCRHPMLQSVGGVTLGWTLGIADVMQSKAVVLLASGAHKRLPLHRLLTGTISPEFPASLLRKHPVCHLFCDWDAYSEPL